MTYQFFSSLGGMIPPLTVLVVLFLAHRTRKRVRYLLAPEPVRRRLPRPSKHRLQLWLVLVPLRLIAGRRPLLARLQRADRTYTAALETDLGMAVNPFDDALAAFGLPTSAESAAFNSGVPVSAGGQFPVVSYEQLGEALRLATVDTSNDPDPVMRSLRNRRNAAWARAKLLADTAAQDNRTFTAEETAQWEAVNVTMDYLDRRIKTILDMRDRVAKLTKVKQVKACLPSCTDPTHVVNIRAIGDKQDVWIPATPEHQEMVLSTEATDYWTRYERGRDEARDIVRRIEGSDDA